MIEKPCHVGRSAGGLLIQGMAVMAVALWCDAARVLAAPVAEGGTVHRGPLVPPPHPGVVGHGTAEWVRQPDQFLLKIDLLSEDLTLAGTLLRLKQRREAAQARLKELGFPAGDIRFGSPALLPASAEPPGNVPLRPVAATAEPAAGNTSLAVPELPNPGPTGFTVRLMLPVLAWRPLPAERPEEVLRIGLEMEEKIRAADLSGLARLKGACTSCGQGKPEFFYIHRLSEEERGRLLAEACQQARLAAQGLAQVLGGHLGEMLRVEPDSPFQPRALTDLVEGTNLEGLLNWPLVAKATMAGPVKCRVNVQVVFEFCSAKFSVK